jgi:hypothetical protein
MNSFVELNLEQSNNMLLCKIVLDNHSDYYSNYTPQFLFLEIRRTVRFFRFNGIIDPDNVRELITALFSPHPSRFQQKDLDHVDYIVSQSRSDPLARTVSVTLFLKKYAR